MRRGNVDSLQRPIRDIDQDEARLVARAQAGDHGALNLIVERYGEQVYRLALRMLGDDDDARDAQQVTFIRIVKQIRRFRGDAALATWIYAITANVCLTWRRRRQQHRCEALEETAGDVSPQHDPIDKVIAVLEREKITRTLQRLAPDDRLILVLKCIEELDHRAIAQILHCS